MQLTPHISLQELVPPETFDGLHDNGLSLIDKRITILLEKIRTLCGNKSITINTWHFGGTFKYRWYRPKDCKVGAKSSMHKSGKAVDFDVKGMTADEVREVIRENKIELMKLGLRRMEIDISWVHIDLKETGLDYIYEFKP